MKKEKAFRFVWIMMILSMMLLPVGCAKPKETEPIRIGIQAPYTGVGADHGPLVEEGVRLLLEQNNWEVAGRPIELVIGDEDGMDPSVTLERTKKLVEQDNVDILIGPIFGSNQLAVQPYLTEQQVVDISVHYGSWDLRKSGNFFVWPGTNYSSTLPVADFAYDEMGYRKLTLMAPDYDFGHELMASVIDKFAEKGGTIIQEQWVPLGTVDMLPYLTALDKDADALVIWLLTDNLISLIDQYHALELDIPVILIFTLREWTLQELGPKIDGWYCVGDYTWRIDSPTNREFVDAYEKAYEEKPNTTGASAYSAAMIAIEALKVTKGDTSLEALRKAILALELDTPQGRVTFTDNGFAESDRILMKVMQVDGRWVYDVLKTYHVKDPRDQ
jgi:branched-chain amino acid transport system substrate-binding protein